MDNTIDKREYKVVKFKLTNEQEKLINELTKMLDKLATEIFSTDVYFNTRVCIDRKNYHSLNKLMDGIHYTLSFFDKKNNESIWGLECPCCIGD